MKRSIAILTGLGLCTPTVLANDVVFETDEQFATSQAERAEGVAAFQAGNFTLALARMEAALALRPGHTRLLGYVAVLAVDTGDLERAAEAAKLYAATGLAAGDGVQAKLASALPVETWTELRAAFDSNVAPRGEAELHLSVPTEVALVEGIAVAPEGRVFVSSVATGGIYSLGEDGPTQLLADEAYRTRSYFGISYEARRKTLLATYASVEQSPDATPDAGRTGLAEFDLESGELRKDWAFEGSTKEHQIADLFVTSDGAIFVSDALGKAVLEARPEGLQLAFDLPTSMSPQGLAEHSEGALILADYGRGLWRLDRESGEAKLLGVPVGASVLGIDGLMSYRGKLVAIQNGANPQRVVALTLNSGGRIVESVEVLAQGLPGFDEPTLGVATPGGLLFVAGSQWPKFGAGGALRDGAELAPTSILRLPVEGD